MSLTSTVPGAISVLQGHFEAVAAANPALNLGVYLGTPVGAGGAQPNYLMIGHQGTGEFLVGYRQEFEALPALYKSETYGLACSIRCWSGATDPVGQLTNAFTVLDGVLTQLAEDPQGTGSLTPSGVWQVESIETGESGPLEKKGGWGVFLNFTVAVTNVRIQPS